MKPPQGSERKKYVRQMFGRIASSYDLLNRLMTFGRDRSWRDEAITHLDLKGGQLILDVGAGTGDIAHQIKEKQPDIHLVAVDLTPEMLKIGQQRRSGKKIDWIVADAQALPFAPGAFDGVISGYLLRNVPDVDIALAEQYRVLKTRGYFVALDTTPPQKNIFRPFIRFYLKFIIPLLGKLVAGESEAYTYLPETTTQFLSADLLAMRMSQAGFHVDGFVRRMFGSMAIHWGRKSGTDES